METIIDQAEKDALKTSGFEWRTAGGVKVLVCSALEAAGFANGFSTRLGGVSDFPAGDLNLAGYNEDAAENIEENRRRFLAVFGSNYRLATVWQTHDDNIKSVTDESELAETDEKADAVVSNLSNVLAAVKTADCVPVIIGDPEKGVFAAVHAGWRGTVSSIVEKSLNRLTELFGSNPDDLVAAIGPAATCSNYEIGTEVIDAFAANFPNSAKYFKPTREGHALVDLHAANCDQLTAAGVRPENIYTAPFCTMDRPDLFFSYRLEKQKNGKTGRLLSVIGLRN